MKSEDIKVLRERAGETPAVFAERLGVSARTVLRWEDGIASPGPYYVRKLRRIGALLLLMGVPVEVE